MWRYTMRYKKLLFADFICVFGFILIELGLPTILARMIDKGIIPRDMDYIYQQGIWMVVITIIGVAMNILLGYFGARITTNIVRDIRDDLFEKIQTFSHSEYESIGVSSLITRTTNDAYQIMLFMGNILRLGFMTPVMFIASLYMVMRTSPSLGMYVLGALPFLLLAVVGIARLSEPLSKKQQKNLDGINGILRENLSGLRVIRAFVNEKFEESRFNKVNETYTKSSKSLFRLMAAAQPGFFFLFNIVMVLIIWSGTVQISHGDLEVGNLIAFIEYIFHALFSFMLFASVFMMYPRAAVSASRIQEALDMEPAIREEEGVTETATKGYLEFKNVTFAYPGHAESPVIRNVSFKASPGETVAFIGSTGSGKSTFLNILGCLDNLTTGTYTLDGIDVSNMPENDLSTVRNEKIGFVFQAYNLLPKLTAIENVELPAMYKGVDRKTRHEKAKKALEMVGLGERINHRPVEMSGGQKQRVAIARALINDPKIIFADEPTGNLDSKSGEEILNIFKDLNDKGVTILMVTHEEDVAEHTKRIIRLRDGVINSDEIVKERRGI